VNQPHNVLVEGAGTLGMYLVVAVGFVNGDKVGHLHQATLDALELITGAGTQF
jgi:hypothetical protein